MACDASLTSNSMHRLRVLMCSTSLFMSEQINGAQVRHLCCFMPVS